MQPSIARRPVRYSTNLSDLSPLPCACTPPPFTGLRVVNCCWHTHAHTRTCARAHTHAVCTTTHRWQTDKKITYLNLNENNLGSPGGKMIAAALKVNTALTEVDLSLNYIDDEGGKAIAEALDANKTLKILNMSGNEIEDKELRKKCRSRKL